MPNKPRTGNTITDPNQEVTQDPDRRGRRHGPLERVTVNLTPRSAQALAEAAKLTRDTKTDTINRALQIYAFIETLLDSGGSLYVRRSDDGEFERLTII